MKIKQIVLLGLRYPAVNSLDKEVTTEIFRGVGLISLKKGLHAPKRSGNALVPLSRDATDLGPKFQTFLYKWAYFSVQRKV